jgi:hypothetical protein
MVLDAAIRLSETGTETSRAAEEKYCRRRETELTGQSMRKLACQPKRVTD